MVAMLRREAGRNPYDRNLTDLVGELSTRSELFRKLWSAHEMLVFSAPPGSPSHDALQLLSAWSATPSETTLETPSETTGSDAALDTDGRLR
jgi:hypothetical protein